MKKLNFCSGWTFSKQGESAKTPVTLPHDAQILERRSADASATITECAI